MLIDRLSVGQRIAELTDRLERETRFTFVSMFSFEGRSVDEIRHDAVVTFLALLEMAKLRLVRITQHVPGDDAPTEQNDEEIYIERATDDLRARFEQTVARPDDYR